MIWEAIQRKTQLVIASIPWTQFGASYPAARIVMGGGDRRILDFTEHQHQLLLESICERYYSKRTARSGTERGKAWLTGRETWGCAV